jgi:hypothetical protein
VSQDLARKSRPDRKCATGAGRHFEPAFADCLLMVIMYYRLYVTEPLLSYLFDLDPSSINQERNYRMVPALCEVLPMAARYEVGLVGSRAAA